MSEFVVHTYLSEIEYLKWLVIRKENIETGGDLFGLWINKNEVVIQLISGPGEKCERTPVSFHQEVGYLQNVGEHLTIKEGLCNVGEWHSHHRLGLARPSVGDEQTVWGNMLPMGLSKFVLFIANISAGSKKAKVQDVNVGCFLFDKASNKLITGRLVFVSEHSPLRRKPEIENVLEKGAEIQEGATPSNKKRGKNRNKRKNKKISPTTGSSVEDNKEVLDDKDEGGTAKKISNRREKSEKEDEKIAKKEKKKNEIGERCEESNEGKQKEIVNCNEMKDGEKIEENEKQEREQSTTNGKLETDDLKDVKQELQNEENEEKVVGAEKEQENQNNQDNEINPDAAQHENNKTEDTDKKEKMSVQEKELGMMKENEDASQKEGKEMKTVFDPKHQGNNKSKKKVIGAEKEQENQNNQDNEINPDAAQHENNKTEDKKGKSKMNVQEKELGMKKENEDASQKEGKEMKTVFRPKHQGSNKSKKKHKGGRKKKK